jgi:hypothetical protein
MKKTILAGGGVLIRFLEALNGFKTKHGYWPDSFESDESSIALLATELVTPLGFFLIQSKVRLRVVEGGKIVTKGRDQDSFDYGREVWDASSPHKHDALTWLGLDD